MKQAMLIREKEFEIQEVGMPVKKKEEVLVRVSSVGICGSDLHVYAGHHPKVKAPIVLGHECTGIIAETLEGTELKAGTPVAIMPLIGCGQCQHCLKNKPNICINRQVIGFQRSGALAETISVPVDNIITLPKNFDLRTGIMYEPLSVIIHAAKLAEITNRRDVLITGAGTIGLLTGTYLRDTYDLNIIFLEINPNRIEFAKKLGFQVVTNIAQCSEELQTPQRPIVFECTGNLKVFEGLMEMHPAPSKVIIVSTFEKTNMYGLHALCRYETSLIGSQMYTMEDVEEAIQILGSSKKKSYEALVVKKKFSINNVQEAYEESIQSTDGVKVIIDVASK
ncbi:zinc-dependent alcohol dehydrogenase [Metabacillus sp. Hm71]|uniref:zinc-dependent alcohol dehydrogenase n=1 Tax=Metabacillus sp. Hm71 TaxID=3450743 RepID=UPI003F43686F